MFLVDTDVLSALAKRRRHASVEAWIGRPAKQRAFCQRHQPLARSSGNPLAARQGPEFCRHAGDVARPASDVYCDRVLPFDLASARRWGQLSAALGHHGADLQIAATALEHGLTVVTRNISDFEPTGAPTLDPFRSPPSRTP